MKTKNSISRTLLTLAVVLMFCGLPLYAQSQGTASPEETKKNTEILQKYFETEKPENAQIHDVAMAVLQLTQTGTEAAVPILKKLLADDHLNTVVRTNLINIPGDAGIAALRESLETLQGKNLAGVIESLASIRDEKSVEVLTKLAGNTDMLVADLALTALGKIATPNAVKTISDYLSDPQKTSTAANAALFAVERLTETNKKEDAVNLCQKLIDFDTVPDSVKNVVLRTKILLDEEKYLQQFIDLLKKKDDSQWKTVLDLANQLKSPQTSRLIIEHFGSLSNEKKATLLEVIGSRKDAAVVPELIEFAQGDEPITKIAAVKTLGRISDFRGLDAILHAVSSSDKNLADVGKASLGLIQGADFNATIIKILDSKEKAVRLAALYVIGERHIAEAAQKVTVLFNDSDTEIRLAAYQTFAQAIVPTTNDFERLLISFQTAVEKQMPVTELDVLRDALKTVCRKMPDRNASIAVIEKKLKTAGTGISETENQVFFMELLFSLGGEQAVKVVAAAALATPHDAVRDKATDILGRWTTPDVAPFLFDLAQKFPAGTKYQVRTLRGYIRVIRQMGIAVDEKVEMSKKALSLAKRDEDKQLAQETLERFSRIVRGTPLFDGKTYENWEFRNNENAQWFRIENAAIVGGTFKEKIPRNEFITTKQEYGDFTLRLEVKVIGEGANAGVQFRSQRLPQNEKNANEVAGYQADMTNTFKFWGSLYDESRRNKFLAEADAEIVKPIFRKDDWNELEIVCKGNTIKISLNGIQTIEYTETDENIPRKGIIGLQIHSGNPSEAWYRNIRIE